ncbi:MAG TPA: type 1 glutamine amidotransferase [Nitrosomonas sp.]|nr:type 1 glutamine amidotransferase [Nitrosomonas sp.]
MIIGLLQCDHVLSEHRVIATGDYDAIYAGVLMSAKSRMGLSIPIQIQSFAVVDGFFPKSPSLCEAWIVSSSKFNAFSSIGWISRLRDFVSRIIESGLPIAGICFGHQIISLAMGGRVSRRPDWIVGVQEIYFSHNAWIKAPRVKLLGIHRDEVIEPPSNATVIGSTEQVRIAAYIVTPNVLCIQYHMELNAGYVRALMETRKEMIGRDVCERAIIGLQTPTDDKQISSSILSFLLSNVNCPDVDAGLVDVSKNENKYSKE